MILFILALFFGNLYAAHDNKTKNQAEETNTPSISLKKSGIISYAPNFVETKFIEESINHNTTTLTSVDFSNCKFVDNAVIAILGKLKKLKMISLVGCNQVTGAGVACLPKTIETAMFSSTQLQGNGIETLENLQKLALKSLASTPIENKHLQYLGMCIKIRELDISNSLVTDEGFKHLINLKLEYLNASRTTVIGSGLCDLEGSLNSLTTLNFNDTNLIDEHFPKIAEFKNLKYFLCDKCHLLTKIGVHNLAIALKINNKTNLAPINLISCDSFISHGLGGAILARLRNEFPGLIS